MGNSKRKLGSINWEKKYYPYSKTREFLKNKYNATPEEIAAWIYIEPVNGGISAYTNVNELDDQSQFLFSMPSDDRGANDDSEADNGNKDFNYVKELEACYFKIDDVKNFNPKERFITNKELFERWSEIKNIDAFIHARIAESMLYEIHPTDGFTQWTDDDPGCPKKEEALFPISEIEKVEALHKKDVNIGRDSKLQLDAEKIAAKWIKEGGKKVTKRKISDELAGSNEWCELTSIRIERVIKKTW